MVLSLFLLLIFYIDERSESISKNSSKYKWFTPFGCYGRSLRSLWIVFKNSDRVIH